MTQLEKPAVNIADVFFEHTDVDICSQLFAQLFDEFFDAALSQVKATLREHLIESVNEWRHEAVREALALDNAIAVHIKVQVEQGPIKLLLMIPAEIGLLAKHPLVMLR